MGVEPLAYVNGDAWVQRRNEHSILRITPEALSAITTEQWHAIERLLTTHDLRVAKGGLDLPGGYLEFHNGDGTLYGGIAPDGQVST